MRKFLKLIYQFVTTVYLFQSYAKFKKINQRGITFFFIKSLKEVKVNKVIKKYFKKNKFKLNRFRKKSKFIGLRFKNEIISSGWIYFGKDEWNVEEINKKIRLNKQYLLYDFITEKKFRNMGYYQLLLRIIQNKFQKKRLIIYALSNNKKSVRAIEKSGFKLIRKLKKY